MATFYNSATLSYNGNVTNSNIITGELLEVISASKTAVIDSYTTNDGVTYVITITNAGTTAYSGLTITDDLGQYTSGTLTLVPLTYVSDSVLYYINGVLQTTPTVAAGPPLIISGINVPAGGNATIIYEATVNQSAPLATGSMITNEAVISGGGISEPAAVCETITVQDTAQLTISKALCPLTVTENGQLTYTFIIQNSGNMPATVADDVVLTDTFNPILDPITVIFNGAAWTPTTNYTYNTTTGVFSTIPGQITVPAATYTQNTTSGDWTINPGVSTLVVTGTV